MLTYAGDEVKNVRTRVPYSMIVSTLSNAIMQWGFIICLLFTIGDIEKVMASPTGLPIIEVYYQATGSKAATNVLVLMSAFIIFFALFNVFASASRLIWAFARDHGLPFHHIFSAVSLMSSISLPTYHAHTYLDTPEVQNAPQRPRSHLCDFFHSITHLHWLLNRLQRHCLSNCNRPQHLLRYPNLLLLAKKDPGPVSNLRTLSPWKMGHPYQSCLPCLPHLHHHLDALPSSIASYSRDDELRRTCPNRYYISCFG
jgi:hypothetical protein